MANNILEIACGFLQYMMNCSLMFFHIVAAPECLVTLRTGDWITAHVLYSDVSGKVGLGHQLQAMRTFFFTKTHA